MENENEPTRSPELQQLYDDPVIARVLDKLPKYELRHIEEFVRSDGLEYTSRQLFRYVVAEAVNGYHRLGSGARKSIKRKLINDDGTPKPLGEISDVDLCVYYDYFYRDVDSWSTHDPAEVVKRFASSPRLVGRLRWEEGSPWNEHILQNMAEIIKNDGREYGTALGLIKNILRAYDGEDFEALAHALFQEYTSRHRDDEYGRVYKSTMVYALEKREEMKDPAFRQRLLGIFDSVDVDTIAMHPYEYDFDARVRVRYDKILLGYKAIDLVRKCKNIPSESMEWMQKEDKWLTPYPHESQNINNINRWYGLLLYDSGPLKNGYAIGYNISTLGAIVRAKIDPVRHDIHDASYWLGDMIRFNRGVQEAHLPETLRDVAADPERELSESDKVVISSDSLRDEFFQAVLNMPHEQRQRLCLPEKPGAELKLFADLETCYAYNALVSCGVDGVPLYKSADFTAEAWQNRIDETWEQYLDQNECSLGRTTSTFYMHKEFDSFYVVGAAQSIEPENAHQTHRQVSVILQELKQIADNRRRYQRDMEQWLLRNVAADKNDIVQAWGSRSEALASGCDDNVRAILAWTKTHEIELALAGTDAKTREYISAPEQKIALQLLLEKLSPKDTVKAMTKMRKWREKRDWTDKVLPAQDVTVRDDAKNKYSFQVLGADDPRGFTIGIDTGCCMTLNGIAKSCIRAGYEYRNAGFVALYDKSGRICAQSYWYIHPDHPETLVIDNIETNHGRDNDKIVELYQQALARITTDMVHITRVTVGTGYSDVTLKKLPDVRPVPPLDGIYTDARHQKLLLGDN